MPKKYSQLFIIEKKTIFINIFLIPNKISTKKKIECSIKKIAKYFLFLKYFYILTKS